MKVTTDYSGFSPEIQRAECLKDVREFLGEKAFDKLVNEMRAVRPPPSITSFSFAMDLLRGISGLPVLHFYNYIYNTTITKDQFVALINESIKKLETSTSKRKDQ